MKNLQFKHLNVVAILFFLMFLPSCNNEELLFVDDYALVDNGSTIVEETPQTGTGEETTPNTEDVAPVDLVDDSFTTIENVPVEIIVHTNDKNLPTSGTISNTNPSSGTLNVNDNSTPSTPLDDIIIYTPNPSFSGIDTFEYTICDGANPDNCDTAVVTINVEPLVDDIAMELKAFPNAYGAGAYTTGGRGGKVIHVTNLNDSGAGSLREALTTSGSRYIVFDVSGVISLNSQIVVPYGDFTVNGFSAPYGGITIIGYAIICDNIDNIIWRGIRFRNGYRGQTGYTNATELQHREVNDLVVDRCSFAYAGDGGNEGKGVSFVTSGSGEYGGNGTIQNCLFTQSKEAYMVGNTGYDDFGDVSCLRNVATTLGWRHPKVGGVNYIDIVNNISHDWTNRLIRLDAFATVKLNLMNNLWSKPVNVDWGGPAVHGYNDVGETPTIYENGNIITPNEPTNYSTQPWKAWFKFTVSGDSPSSSSWTGTKITGINGVEAPILDTADLKTELLPKVGACEYMQDNGTIGFYRDAIDSKAVNTVENDLRTIRVSTSSYQSLAEDLPNTMPSNTRPGNYDTDNDGMCDSWETAMFGNLSKTATGDEDNDGYTNIEEFLNQVDQ